VEKLPGLKNGWRGLGWIGVILLGLIDEWAWRREERMKQGTERRRDIIEGDVAIAERRQNGDSKPSHVIRKAAKTLLTILSLGPSSRGHSIHASCCYYYYCYYSLYITSALGRHYYYYYYYL